MVTVVKYRVGLGQLNFGTLIFHTMGISPAHPQIKTNTFPWHTPFKFFHPWIGFPDPESSKFSDIH